MGMEGEMAIAEIVVDVVAEVDRRDSVIFDEEGREGRNEEKGGGGGGCDDKEEEERRWSGLRSRLTCEGEE